MSYEVVYKQIEQLAERSYVQKLLSEYWEEEVEECEQNIRELAVTEISQDAFAEIQQMVACEKKWLDRKFYMLIGAQLVILGMYWGITAANRRGL